MSWRRALGEKAAANWPAGKQRGGTSRRVDLLLDS